MAAQGVLYLDCSAGISGDMTVGALLHIGVPISHLQKSLDALNLPQKIELKVENVSRAGINCQKFNVILPNSSDLACEHSPLSHSKTTWSQIRKLLDQSLLPETVKNRSISLFRRIAIAEAKIHGVPEENVHFHEVGALDSIADIVCTCAALDFLGWPQIFSSWPQEGTGTAHCQHGQYPLPTPAVVEILQGIPLRQIQQEGEHITPTGAAILAEFVTHYGPMPLMKIEKVGYGAGSRNPQDYPNALRILLGLPLTVSHPDLHSSPQASLNSPISHSHDESPPQEVVEIRANLDDSTPEIIGYLIELLLKKGALDAWCTPATMKKSRPGFILHAITTPEQTTLISNLILRESSTFGIRFHTCQRRVLSRKYTEVPTPYGQIRMKLGYLNGELLRVEPEYESCSQVALITDTPLNKVYDAAKSAWEFLTEHK